MLEIFIGILSLCGFGALAIKIRTYFTLRSFGVHMSDIDVKEE